MYASQRPSLSLSVSGSVRLFNKILDAAPTWWDLSHASDCRLRIDHLQRIEYTSHDHPTVESKVQKAEEKLFRNVAVEEETRFLLKLYNLPQKNAFTHNL